MGPLRRLASPTSWASLPLDRRVALVIRATPWSAREAEAACDFADHLLSAGGLPARVLLGLAGATAAALIIGSLSDMDVTAVVVPYAMIYVLLTVAVAAPLTWRLRRRARTYLDARTQAIE